MEKFVLLLLTTLMLLVGKTLRWLSEFMEDAMSKESEALDALDAAIEAAAAWKAAEDENDAAAILERTAALNALFAPAAGQPVDALTGLPVTGSTSSPGPLSPEEAAALNAPAGTQE